MRALVVAPQPFFSPRGTPYSVYYRTLVLSELGVEIDVLTYGEGDDVELPGVRIIRIPRFGFLGPVKIGPSALKLFLDGFVLLWAFGLLLRKRYDFVHAHEESVFFCRFLKPLFRFKLVYDMHSSLPQQLTNFSYTSSRAIIRLFSTLEDNCLRNSDAVITICPALASYAISKLPEVRRHFLIENSVFDAVRLANGSHKGFAYPSISLPENRPLIVYAGTFEPYQGLDVLIQAFTKVLLARADAFLLMIGGNPDQVSRLRAVAKRSGLDGSCLIEGRVDQATARGFTGRADVLMSPRTEGINTPLKIYELLASGKPLVATRIQSHTQVLNDYVCFLVDPTPEDMARGILAALRGDDSVRKVVSAARNLYDRKYSRSAYETKLHKVLEVLR